MAAEWREATVGDIAAPVRNALVGGPFGSNLVSRDYVDAGVPVIRGQNMAARWVSGEFAFVTDAKADSLDANLARPGDIVFTQRGTLGQVSVVPAGKFERYLVSQSQMKLTVNRKTVDPMFIYYVFSSAEQQDYMRRNAIQTGVPHTNLGILRGTPVAVPPLSEQRAIAHILGTLDDKIELNRRMNETLETMARALFKSWFVDFDPVRAKAEGRDPGLPEPLADLFPDSFVDSELGEIPKGWAVRPLRELAGYLSRGIGPVYIDVGGICVLNQKCVRDHRIDFSKARRHDAGKKSIDGRMLRPLDILVNSTGVGTLGRIAQLWHLPERAVIDSHITVIRSAAGVDPWFLGRALMRREADIESLGEGSTGQTELGRARLGELTVLVPPLDLQASFGRVVEPLLLRVSGNESANATVAALRDMVLPKLISGDVRLASSATIDVAP